tara:strand:- start:1481 stop:2692 length:1212 start_codon:yes stop_codon:yes gene_type:complete
MENCFRCEKTDKEIRLLDAIYENDIVKICDKCAIIEGIPVIKKPSTSQLRDSERFSPVYERLNRISGLKNQEEKHESVLNQLKNIEEHPELTAPEEKRPFSLIENFHWQVMRARRNRGLSQKQLGWAIGESEMAIKMIEKSELPEDAEKLIRKLEQFFQIKLRERTEAEIREEELKKEAKLKEASRIPEIDSNEFDSEIEETISIPIEPIIKEPELEQEDLMSIASGEKIASEKLEKELGPSRVLSFRQDAMQDLTVSDLQKMKEGKEQEDRMEKLEEETKREIQADTIVNSVENENKSRSELKERIALEMKEAALEKIEERERKKRETVAEKRKMLGEAIVGIGKTKEEKKKEKEKEKTDEVPKIHDLLEKRKQKEEEAIVGDDIEIDDFENIEEELKEEEI